MYHRVFQIIENDLKMLETINRQDFIKRLLTVDPNHRLTAHQALTHSWLVDPIINPLGGQMNRDLLSSVRQNFNARKTFKKAVDAVKAINSLKSHSRSASLANLLEKSRVEADEDVQQVLAV